MDEERKFGKMYFKFRASQEVRENILARTLNILRLWRRKEMHGTLSYTPEGKWDSICDTDGGTILKETGHLVFKSISPLSCGILKRMNRDTIHIRADASNTELLFRTIYTAQKQRSSCFWCEEFGQMPNEREPTSERFVAKENVQLLKNVKTQEGNSFGANSKE